MSNDEDSLIYSGGGPLAAVLLGIALIPLRGFTTASNFTFAFVVLTIVVAELGGRRAAVATALTSALSLDFFLTHPYLKLTIEDKHDIIAFVGLAVCGLVAAALGSKRGERVTALRTARHQLQALQQAVRSLAEAGPIGPQLVRVLDESRAAFPLAGLVVRDEQGHVVAASEPAQARATPAQILEPESLLPAGASDRQVRAGLALPAEGGRLALVAGTRPVGWLDLWGNGTPAPLESRRVLSEVARLVALRLGSR